MLPLPQVADVPQTSRRLPALTQLPQTRLATFDSSRKSAAVTPASGPAARSSRSAALISSAPCKASVCSTCRLVTGGSTATVANGSKSDGIRGRSRETYRAIENAMDDVKSALLRPSSPNPDEAMTALDQLDWMIDSALPTLR